MSPAQIQALLQGGDKFGHGAILTSDALPHAACTAPGVALDLSQGCAPLFSIEPVGEGPGGAEVSSEGQ